MESVDVYMSLSQVAMSFPSSDLSLSTICSFLGAKDLASAACASQVLRRNALSHGQWKWFLSQIGVALSEKQWAKQPFSPAQFFGLMARKKCLVCSKSLACSVITGAEKKLDPPLTCAQCKRMVHRDTCVSVAEMHRCSYCDKVKCEGCANWRGCDGCGAGVDDNPPYCSRCWDQHGGEEYCPGCEEAHAQMEGMDY